MKKQQEMIKIMKAQEQELYIKVQKCLEVFGAYDPVTESAITRWATINQLLKSLGL